MRLDSFRAACAGALVALSLSGLARAQCDEWTPTFAAAPAPTEMRHGVAFDDGNGEKLYFGLAIRRNPPFDNTPAIARVQRWTGRLIETVYDSGTAPAGEKWSMVELLPHTSGMTHALYSVELRVLAGGAEQWIVRHWNGGPWTTLGTFNAQTHLAFADDGSGPALVAGGAFTTQGGLPTANVVRWNGVAWIPYGAGIGTNVNALASFDAGTGPRLYAAASSGGQAVHVWNGASWSPAGVLGGTCTSLVVSDVGGSTRLHASGTLDNGAPPTQGLASWDGSTWSLVAATPFDAKLCAGDLGAGPRLWLAATSPYEYDGASLTLLGTTTVSTPWSFAVLHGAGGARLALFALNTRISPPSRSLGSIAFWNGAVWSALGHGLAQGEVRDLQPFDDGSGTKLYAAGALMYVPQDGVLGKVLTWNGSAWQMPAQQPDNTTSALAVANAGGTTSLFVTGTFLNSNSPATSTSRIARWTGAAWEALGSGLSSSGNALVGFDDGSGPELCVAGDFGFAGGVSANHVAAWNGSSWRALGNGLDQPVQRLAVYDAGGGARLHAAGGFTASGATPLANIARWDGSAWSALGAGVDGTVSALCVFQGELWAGGIFTHAGGIPVGHLARWNGTTWSDVPGGGANGGVLALHVHDGALYVGGGFNLIGGTSVVNLARFDGTHWESVDGGVLGLPATLESFDDDGDGNAELFVGGVFTQTATAASNLVARLAGCPRYTSFCFGDGSLTDHTTPCPCGNNGAPGNGCAHSFDAGGANLSASGSTFADTVVLRSQFEPVSSFTLFLQQANQGDAVFHDGVVCAANPLVRLRGRSAAFGEAFFPNSTFAQDTTTSLSIRGGVTIGSGVTRYYSAFYRNASTTFCPPATANVTNGVRVIW